MTFERRAHSTKIIAGSALVTLVLLTGGWIGLTGGLPAGAADATSAAPTTTAAVSPAAFNPTCAYVTDTICVSLATSTEPNIIPASGQFTSAVEPSNATSIPLFVKSEKPLNGSSPILSGPDANVELNVTGVLWNGDQYYNPYDGSIWHSATAQDYIGPLTPVQTGNNQTYPWWYEVNFSARTSTGQANFFAGMSITWSIAINVNNSNSFTRNQSPSYHFTYSGAWPASPYAGSSQYTGQAAFAQDINVRVVPAAPNWNDSLSITLRTTTADTVTNASIESARVLLSESSPNGTPLVSAVIPYTPIAGSLGVASAEITIPSTLNLDPNATVTYSIAATDYWGDTVISQSNVYIVGGNGSFPSAYFNDALNLTASPNVTALVNFSTPEVAPGTPISLDLASRYAPDAINAAEVVYTVALPEIGSVAQYSTFLTRFNSTYFYGSIPGLPLQAQVSFVVQAWDFHSTMLVSPEASYQVESFAQVVPILPSNQSFFYVAVYDAGSSSWVNGAHLSISGQSGFVHSVGTTFDGLAYPNATGGQYQPLVVPAGGAYSINLTDSHYVAPAGVTAPAYFAYTFTAAHSLSGHAVLYSGATWSVVQEGNLLLFYLNTTAVAPSAASPGSNVMEVATIAALIVVTVAVVPLVLWWRQIQKRRDDEVKRVTL